MASTPTIRRSRHLVTTRGVVVVIRLPLGSSESLNIQNAKRFAVYQHGRLLGVIYCLRRWAIMGASQTFSSQKEAIEALFNCQQSAVLAEARRIVLSH